MVDEARERVDDETELVTWAVQEAVARAIEEHRRLGYPIAVSRDGRVVWIAPEDIPPYVAQPQPAGRTRRRR
jgi:hypothetical protein